MPIGNQVHLDPIPPVPENTRWFSAGPVSFGVEYRVLDDDLLALEYPEGMPGTDIDDKGVSIHVNGTVDGQEYLRFDCFDDGPHYHYLLPDQDHQYWVPFDETANGPMLTWAISRLRTRLQELLVEAGGASLAGSCDDAVLATALDKVEEAARGANALTVDPHEKVD